MHACHFACYHCDFQFYNTRAYYKIFLYVMHACYLSTTVTHLLMSSVELVNELGVTLIGNLSTALFLWFQGMVRTELPYDTWGRVAGYLTAEDAKRVLLSQRNLLLNARPILAPNGVRQEHLHDVFWWAACLAITVLQLPIAPRCLILAPCSSKLKFLLPIPKDTECHIVLTSQELSHLLIQTPCRFAFKFLLGIAKDIECKIFLISCSSCSSCSSCITFSYKLKSSMKGSLFQLPHPETPS